MLAFVPAFAGIGAGNPDVLAIAETNRSLFVKWTRRAPCRIQYHQE
jgi:hypothetical protein